MKSNLLFVWSAVVGALGLAGCSSVTVKDVHNQGCNTAARPAQIAVVPFSLEGARVKENSSRKHPGQLGPEVQELLNTYLAKELQKLAPVVTLAAGQRVPKNTWVVSGRITRLEEGSRLLRMSMGLGMGGTKMETEVTVDDCQKRIMQFATTGGSNAMPGAVTTPVPFTGLPAALRGASDGVTDDAARTARMITGAIAREMVKRGWLAAAPYKTKFAENQ